MRNKNYPIKVMLDKETYDNFIKKCEDLGISMTLFIEKIANEEIIFIDENIKSLLELLYKFDKKKIIKNKLFKEKSEYPFYKVTWEGNLKILYHDLKIDNQIDAEHYVTGFFSNLGWRVLYTNGRELKDYDNLGIVGKIVTDILKQENKLGRPDLIAIKGKRVIFIEVKTNSDGLRGDQMKWIIDHPKYNILVFYLNQMSKNNGKTN